uniref:Uncharacterized protein n=1 Tax=Acrobeloides nanus TaxID=290746 RepID=A0A914CM11_9BILA
MITVDDGNLKAYFVPSGSQVFLKICNKAQNLITLKNTTQQYKHVGYPFYDVNKCDLVLAFKSSNRFHTVSNEFEAANFTLLESYHLLTKMLPFNFDIDDKYTLTVTQQMITVDDGNEKVYFVPSDNKVFLKNVRNKAQILITLKNTTQQSKYYDNYYNNDIIKGDLVLAFKSPNLFCDARNQFVAANFVLSDV